MLGCYGDPIARTPNLNRLAAEGCRFDQAYTTAPVCSPARSTLVTGQYPVKIGTHHHRSVLSSPPRLFTHELRDAGYYVSWPTKLDFNFEPTDGWRDDGDPWIERLRRRALPDQPWFFYVNFEVTHESGMWPEEPTSPGRPGRAAWRDPSQQPPPIHAPHEVGVPPYLPDTHAVRADIARHYDNIAALDAQVGNVLAALDASGRADDTVVIFLADHGRGLPREKRWLYPAGLHMPLIIRWPGRLAPGSSDQQLVSWIDVAPTILSLAGVPAPAAYDGRMFMGPAAQHRQWAFAARDRMDEAFDRCRAAFDSRWWYIRNFHPEIPYAQTCAYMEHMPTMQELRRLHAEGRLSGAEAVFMQDAKPPEELYNRETDPHCTHNLACDPGHDDVKRRLAEILDRWIKDTGDLEEKYGTI